METHKPTPLQLFRAYSFIVDRRSAQSIALNEQFVKTGCEVCKIVGKNFKSERESLRKQFGFNNFDIQPWLKPYAKSTKRN